MIKLLKGDCLELMQEIPDNSIDLILTDPPYGTTACKWDTVIPFEPMWKEIKRVRKERAAVALFGSEPFSSYLRMSNIKEFKYDWVWKKTRVTGHFNAKKAPMKAHEVVSVFYIHNYYPIKTKAPENLIDRRKNIRNSIVKAGGIYNESKDYIKVRSKDYGMRYPISIQEFKNSNNNMVHPTQKPVALLEYLIKTYTNEGETVLDFTMGSGSTGVACVNLNRRFIGIEKGEKYFEIAEKRIYAK
jgi:DNA modification methylase